MEIMGETHDRIIRKVEWSIHKFRDPTGGIAEILRSGMSIENLIDLAPELFLGSEEWEGNVGLNTGLQYLIDMICGIGTTTKWDNSNARLGVGSDATAPSASQTDLIDVTPTWKAMDATYPQRSGQVAEWRSTFGSGDANEAWEEYAVDNGATVHKLLNRCTASKGTKVIGEVWALSLKITFS